MKPTDRFPGSFRNMVVFAGAAACLLLAGPTLAAEHGAVHDPHQPADSEPFQNEEFQKTIETRCTICHTREQIDAAMKSGEAIEALMQRMIERGAILTERDKGVLGTFWGSPMKQQAE